MSAQAIPQFYLMTGSYRNEKDFKEKLNKALSQGDRIVQLKNKNKLLAEDYISWVKTAKHICQHYNARLLLATSAYSYKQCDADSLHLNSKELFKYPMYPLLISNSYRSPL
ncbi:MAG: thiamine phosphate synthase [Pseudomonadota bacterium]